MDLEGLIQKRLDSMLRENPKRVDYYERYQTIIEEYKDKIQQCEFEKKEVKT